MAENHDFETLIDEAKNALNQLKDEKLTLKENLEIYKKGLESLNQAQKILEEAKLEYTQLNLQKDLIES